MRSTPWSRCLAATLAVWFALITVDPALVHSCPMHETRIVDGETVPQLSASTIAGGTDEHDGHHADAPSDQQEHDQSCCTCIGDCSGPPIAWTRIADPMPTPLVGAMVDRGLPDYAYIPVAAAHVLPFANGPPIRA